MNDRQAELRRQSAIAAAQRELTIAEGGAAPVDRPEARRVERVEVDEEPPADFNDWPDEKRAEWREAHVVTDEMKAARRALIRATDKMFPPR